MSSILPYDHEFVEKEAQAHWETNHSFRVTEKSAKEKFYCLSMLPYPSGELHMGHVRNYTIGDVIARYQHMQGKNVLQPMGWDAFGLPAENAALKHQVAPAKWTYQNIADMRVQLKRLGYAIDWSREVATCMPDYYRWEQWLFTRLVKKGLAYRKNSVVNWDPVDKTVLANEQVIDGRGWRSGALVERREIPQWFLKITDYADELLEELSRLEGWPEQVRVMQENWIGRSQGLRIQFDVVDSSNQVEIYTTRPDTLLGVTYLAVAPDHPIAQRVAQKNANIATFLAACRHKGTAEAALATMEKKGVDTGEYAINPFSGERVPIWVANYVLMEYGSGAVMAVPAIDERDFEFATKYKLPIKSIPEMSVDEANVFSETLIQKGYAKKQTHYRLRDWGISRQRYWGAPIPIIYCDACGAVPVPDKDLPVKLPEDVVLLEAGSPLKSLPDFYHTTCPECGKPAVRETDTFDTFMESSWYFIRYTCPDQHNGMTDERAHYWAPVDQYVGGVEHAVLHLLYARFLFKVMRDEGLVTGDEPFTRLLTQGMVLKDGHKMSKSKGNTVSPLHLVQQYGADTARLFTIFAAPPEQSLEWSDAGVEGAHRFLKRVWALAYGLRDLITHAPYAEGSGQVRQQIHQILQQATQDIERLQLNTVVSACMKMLNTLSEVPKTSENAAVLSEGLRILLLLLSPISPHITHHLWRALGYGEDIRAESWPSVDESALRVDTVSMVVQVNGKLRGKIVVAVDEDARRVEEIASSDPHIQQFVTGAPKKVVVVPNKLINIVV